MTGRTLLVKVAAMKLSIEVGSKFPVLDPARNTASRCPWFLLDRAAPPLGRTVPVDPSSVSSSSPLPLPSPDIHQPTKPLTKAQNPSQYTNRPTTNPNLTYTLPVFPQPNNLTTKAQISSQANLDLGPITHWPKNQPAQTYSPPPLSRP